MGGQTKVKSDMELVSEPKDEKNWKGIGLALLVIVVVLSLVITASVLVIPASKDVVMGSPYSLEAKNDPNLSPNTLQAAWAGADTYVHRNEEGSLVAVDLRNNATTFIMSNTTFRQLNTFNFWVSPDLQYVLLAYNTAYINRYTQSSFYNIYDVKSKKLRPLPAGSEETLSHASWGPDGNSLAFVKQNALYYQASVDASPVALTPTDDPPHIYNAIPDWLYEEEITKASHAYWWSPGGAHIAYLRLDDKEVPEFKFPTYTDKLNVQGTFRSVRYPKAGHVGTNPKVELHVVNVKQAGQPRASVKIDPPAAIKKTDHYLMCVAWRDASTLAVTWLNRAQNLSTVVLCRAQSASCMVSLTQTTKSGAIPWLDTSQKPVFTADGSSYFLVLPQQDGTAGYYQHVSMVATSTNQEGHRTFLTHGQFDVTQVVGYDDKQKDVYVIAAYDSPMKRRLLKIGTPQSQTPKKVTCLSCDFVNDTCESASATFSPSGSHYFLSCLGPAVPTYYLRSTDDPNFNVTMEGNEAVKKRLEKVAMPKRELHTITIAGGKFNSTLRLYLPPQLNKQHVITYPTLLYVYGGPNSQLVTDTYIRALDAYLSSGQSMIVASLDARGTSGRGSKFKQDLYRNMGTVEVDDQIDAIKYLRTLPYVDADNIAVYGWSYGGFLTGHIVGRGTGLVHCAVIGAPVTDFRYYDTFWTERFMGFSDVSDNLNGYEATSVMKRVEGFKKTKVLIIHGTGDDNVHYQNSAHLMRALTEAGVQYEVQVYPDEKHALSPSATRHVTVRMTNFLNNCYNNATRDYIAHPATREPEKVYLCDTQQRRGQLLVFDWCTENAQRWLPGNTTTLCVILGRETAVYLPGIVISAHICTFIVMTTSTHSNSTRQHQSSIQTVVNGY